MISRQERKERKALHNQAMQRYHKQRQRNCLAQPGAHAFALVLDNLKAGFNVPKIFRSAEAFGAAEVHLVNIGPFDPAAAKGSFRKVPARFHEQFEQAYEDLSSRGYTLFTLEPNAETTLYDVELPERSAFIFGHEEMGITFNKADYPEIRNIAIPQYGDVESLNVSIAASIVMYEYVGRYRNKIEEKTREQAQPSTTG